jgi:general secretion pathway protein G
MTLIEIMVVITILGLMAAAVGVAIIPRLEQAKVDQAKIDINNIEGALKLYYAKKGNYPDTATGLKALVDTQMLEKQPKDPWGNEYVYTLEAGRPIITSYGKSGQSGGDTEISSKNLETVGK